MPYTDAADHGFAPENSGLANAAALQRALDRGGEVVVRRPGTYDVSATSYVGSDTSITFEAGVWLRKVVDPSAGPFTHVLLNRAALRRAENAWDERIGIHGLRVIVNGVDVRNFVVFGLHGHLALLGVRDAAITGFRCLDLGPAQYAVHVCTFEDLRVEDTIIHGMKDGVHLGRGKRFVIRDGTFKTYDDAVAINAHDYDVGNPEMGAIEDGLIERCHDLNADRTTGFFTRITSGSWIDWQEGMEVRKSDAVVSGGKVYRVRADPDGRVYRSVTRPTHRSGQAVLDGITWACAQHDVTHQAFVRNVTYRDIWLHKPRTGFSVHFDNDRFSRALYPGSQVPVTQNISLENVHVLHGGDANLVNISAPIDLLRLRNCRFRNGPIHVFAPGAAANDAPADVLLSDCAFAGSIRPDAAVRNDCPGKVVRAHLSNCIST
jgi:hypothetical protein